MTATMGFTLNGRFVTLTPAPGELLCDVIRERLGLTGTHVGCREGVCGSCNVLVDKVVVRSCLMLAVQADGCDVRTVEGLSANGQLSAIQQAFLEHGAVQCGFCTPGLLIAATALLENGTPITAEDIVTTVAGNLCRCTGYSTIVRAIRAVAQAGDDADRSHGPAGVAAQ
jgi:aerobic-type carbon monoxide dehydrogenase small subunit (CoxS/CutS family)